MRTLHSGTDADKLKNIPKRVSKIGRAKPEGIESGENETLLRSSSHLASADSLAVLLLAPLEKEGGRRRRQHSARGTSAEATSKSRVATAVNADEERSGRSCPPDYIT